VEEYSLPIRDVMDDHIKQRAVVWQLRFQGLLLKVRNQEPIFVT